MLGVHPVIQAEIDRIQAILHDRGFKNTVIERGLEFAAIDRENGFFAAKNACLLMIDPGEVKEARGVYLLREGKRFTFKGDVLHGKSWCLVLLDPEETDFTLWDSDSLWEQIYDDTLLYLSDKKFMGYVVLRIPKLYKIGKIEGWRWEIFFLSKKEVLSLDCDEPFDECLPWHVKSLIP